MQEANAVPNRASPHLVVEVVSPKPRDARRDRVDKLRDYARAGVPFCWLVDPALRSLEVLELARDGRYVHALGAASGRLARVPECPGLRLSLDDLWACLDEAPAKRPR